MEASALMSITIPGVDEMLKRRLQARADLHGKSMEDEARDILREALGPQDVEPGAGEPLCSHPQDRRTARRHRA